MTNQLTQTKPLTALPIVEPGIMTEMERFVFDCFGYILIEDVLTPDEVAETLDAAKRLHEGKLQGKLNQIGRGFEQEAAIERLIDHPATLPKVRALLGDRFVLQAAWCTVQPAGSQSVGWHQDGSGAFEFRDLGYPVPLIQLRVTFNLTDQSEPFMGNMMMIPGSHRTPLPMPESAHHEIYACPVQQIITAKPGSVLIFHNGVYHSPMPNDRDFDRYNMHYIYSPPWLRRSDRDATDPAFLERTTPRRRALMGDYSRPDVPFGGGFPAIPFDDSSTPHP